MHCCTGCLVKLKLAMSLSTHSCLSIPAKVASTIQAFANRDIWFTTSNSIHATHWTVLLKFLFGKEVCAAYNAWKDFRLDLSSLTVIPLEELVQVVVAVSSRVEGWSSNSTLSDEELLFAKTNSKS